MQKIVLTFGLIAGAVLSVMLFLTMQFQDAIGFDRGMIIGYASMVLAFLMVYVGIRSYRDSIAGGRVSFGKALQVGLLISLIATICYVATWEIIYFTMMPDFADKMAAASIDQLRAKGASAAEISRATLEMEEFKVQYRNPLVNIAYTLLEPMPVALLFSFVSAWRLSRTPSKATSMA